MDPVGTRRNRGKDGLAVRARFRQGGGAAVLPLEGDGNGRNPVLIIALLAVAVFIQKDVDADRAAGGIRRQGRKRRIRPQGSRRLRRGNRSGGDILSVRCWYLLPVVTHTR